MFLKKHTVTKKFKKGNASFHVGIVKMFLKTMSKRYFVMSNSLKAKSLSLEMQQFLIAPRWYLPTISRKYWIGKNMKNNNNWFTFKFADIFCTPKVVIPWDRKASFFKELASKSPYFGEQNKYQSRHQLMFNEPSIFYFVSLNDDFNWRLYFDCIFSQT